MENRFKMNLQLLANNTEANADANAEANTEANILESTPKQATTNTGDAQAGEEDKKYTDKDLDELIEKKFSKWKKAEEKRVSEAQRLAEMNAQQRAEYERDQYKKEIEQLKGESEKRKMQNVALEMLTQNGIKANNDLVNVLVSSNAEETQQGIQSFIQAFNEALETAVNDKLKSTPPKKFTSENNITKEDIFKVKNKNERQKLIAENIQLFEKEY